MKALALIPLLVGLGCAHPWYLVESTYQPALPLAEEPEVVQTTTYLRGLRDPLAVALRAPDRCADLSSAETTGAAQAAGELIRTTCGVEMAELERALVRAGYKVASWDAVRAMVEHEDRVTPLEAARALNAQVLFQVNSLERSRASGRLGETWKRSFYASNPTGRKGRSVKVAEERARALEDGVRALEQAWTPPLKLSVTVDLTVVDAQTGEAIWFYKATEVADETAPADAEPEVLSQLFECNRRHLHRCLYRDPLSDRSSGVAPSATRAGPNSGGAARAFPARADSRARAREVAGSSTTRSGSEAPALGAEQMVAAYRAAYFELLRDAMAGLVDEFTRGRR